MSPTLDDLVALFARVEDLSARLGAAEAALDHLGLAMCSCGSCSRWVSRRDLVDVCGELSYPRRACLSRVVARGLARGDDVIEALSKHPIPPAELSFLGQDLDSYKASRRRRLR